MTRRIDWDDFKFVQAVAQTGSVRGAGELLRVHGSTVARHLDQLEQRVGTRLFERSARGVAITAAGSEIIEVLDRVANELDQVERSLSARGPVHQGPVVLAASAGLVGDLLLPYLAELYQRQEDVELTLVTAPVMTRLEDGEADLALWATDDPPEDLIGRPLATVMACVYATPACLAAMADAAGGPGGVGARWVGSADSVALSARIRLRHFPELAPGLQLDDLPLRAIALESGLGVGLLPCYLGDARPGLVRAAGLEPVRLGEVWLFSRPESRGVGRIQAVSAFLQELFTRHRPRLAGVEE